MISCSNMLTHIEFSTQKPFSGDCCVRCSPAIHLVPLPTLLPRHWDCETPKQCHTHDLRSFADIVSITEVDSCAPERTCSKHFGSGENPYRNKTRDLHYLCFGHVTRFEWCRESLSKMMIFTSMPWATNTSQSDNRRVGFAATLLQMQLPSIATHRFLVRALLLDALGGMSRRTAKSCGNRRPASYHK